MISRRHLSFAAAISLIAGATVAPAPALAGDSYTFAGAVYGMAAAPDNSLLIADSGAGVVELKHGTGRLAVPLPGVNDAEPLGRDAMYAVTSGENGFVGKLYRAGRDGTATAVADLSAYEASVNPDGADINANPFGVQPLPGGGGALVTDAGANALLRVEESGAIDWIATFPPQDVSSAPAKELAGCPNPPANLAFVCALPAVMPAQAVPTSVVIGPDGAYYVGELKGSPAEPGTSRIWRVDPRARHARCGTSKDCRVVADGFSAIVDLTVGPGGTLTVVEMEENGFLAAALGLAKRGGTVNTCRFDKWTCRAVATGLPVPIAAAVTRGRTVALVDALTPASARVVEVS